MPAAQLGFILFTFLAPPLLWLLSRKIRSQRLVKGISIAMASTLAIAYVGALILKTLEPDGFTWDTALPFHLCDWAALATVLALVTRSQLAFELAYCWGLAGTAQALFTPALEVRDDLRAIMFFTVHSFIPASVLWLIFECKMRPRPGAYFRVMLWSELYLVCALAVNKLSGGNYGFLFRRPPTHSLLDFYSDTWWLYVTEINLTAVILFGLLIVPWQTWRTKQAH